MSMKTIQPKESPTPEEDIGLLLPKQRLFCECLVADPDFNATNAARAAGYKSPGKVTAQLLANPRISRHLGHLIHKRSEKFAITAERVLKELACIAFFNPKSLLKPDGTPYLLHELPDEVACALASVRVTYGESLTKEGTFDRVKHLEARPIDKSASLFKLAEHLGLVKKDGMPVINVIAINWDALFQRKPPAQVNGQAAPVQALPTPPTADEQDEVEARIVKALTDAGANPESLPYGLKELPTGE